MSKIVPKDITFKNVSQYDNYVLVGIDISKDTFHAAFLKKNEYFTDCFKQDISDFNQLLKAVGKTKKILAIMEFSGGYERPLAEFLYENEHAVHIVNGRVFKRLCQTLNIHGKSDKTDPTVLCEYLGMRLHRLKSVAKTDIAVLKKISLFFPNTDEVKQLKAKKKLRDKINDAVGYYSKMKNSYPDRYEIIKDTEKEMKKTLSVIEKNLESLVKKFDCFKYLQSVPCIDVLMAVDLIVITNNFEKIKTVNECRALFGLAPVERSRGTSVNPNAKKHLVNKVYTYAKVRSLLILGARLQSGRVEYLMKLKRQYEAKGHKGNAVSVKIADKILTAAFVCAKKKIMFDDYTKNKYDFQKNLVSNVLPQTQKPMSALATRLRETANDTQFDWFFNPFYDEENLQRLTLENLSLDKLDIKKVFKYIFFVEEKEVFKYADRITEIFDLESNLCGNPFYEAKISKVEIKAKNQPKTNRRVVIFYTEVEEYQDLLFCVNFLRKYITDKELFIKPEIVENCQASNIKAFFTVAEKTLADIGNSKFELKELQFFHDSDHYLKKHSHAH
jgi:hypothetical protein